MPIFKILWKALCLSTVMLTPPALLSAILMLEKRWVTIIGFIVVAMILGFLRWVNQLISSHDVEAAGIGFIVFSLALLSEGHFHTVISVRAMTVFTAFVVYAVFAATWIIKRSKPEENGRGSSSLPSSKVNGIRL